MAPVKKPPHKRAKHFLKQWREFRHISQEEAADRVGMSRSNLSKIESGEVPYNQDLIERLAEAYGCELADLLTRDPNEKPRIPIFDLPKGDADRVYDFIRALQVSRTDLSGAPAPEPQRSPKLVPTSEQKRKQARRPVE